MGADRVRLADWRDDREIFSLLMELRATGSVAQLIPYSPKKVMAQIELGTRPVAGRLGGVIGVVGERGERIVASAGLFFQEPWWSEVPMLVNQWVYVRQEARRGARLYDDLFLWMTRTKADLEAWAKADAEARNEPILPLVLESTHASGDRIEAKDRLWRKYGRRIGGVFIVGS